MTASGVTYRLMDANSDHPDGPWPYLDGGGAQFGEQGADTTNSPKYYTVAPGVASNFSVTNSNGSQNQWIVIPSAAPDPYYKRKQGEIDKGVDPVQFCIRLRSQDETPLHFQRNQRLGFRVVVQLPAGLNANRICPDGAWLVAQLPGSVAVFRDRTCFANWFRPAGTLRPGLGQAGVAIVFGGRRTS